MKCLDFYIINMMYHESVNTPFQQSLHDELSKATLMVVFYTLIRISSGNFSWTGFKNDVLPPTLYFSDESEAMCSFLTIKKLLTQWNLLQLLAGKWQKASNSGCKIPLKQDADVKSNRVIQDREGQMHWVSHLKSCQPTVVKMSK